MTAGLVDIIIPTRNRFDLTVDAISSVQSQTFRDWTVYVVDDASDDGSCDQLRQWTARDTRIVIVERSTQGGPAAARQTGLSKGEAPYVAILDSDDLWKPTKLERQVKVLQEWETAHPEVLGCFSLHTWPHYTRRQRSRLAREAGKAGLVRNPLCTANMSAPLLLRGALERAGGFVPDGGRAMSTSEGIEFFVRLTSFGPLLRHGEVLVECRTHGGTRTSDRISEALGAEELSHVVQTHSRWLAQWPADLARLDARIGVRLVHLDRWTEGLGYLRQAWSRAPRRTRSWLIREYGPHLTKTLVTSLITERRSWPRPHS
jgi:glycosyltransferase involved in cell wall biosynthesis